MKILMSKTGGEDLFKCHWSSDLDFFCFFLFFLWQLYNLRLLLVHVLFSQMLWKAINCKATVYIKVG